MFTAPKKRHSDLMLIDHDHALIDHNHAWSCTFAAVHAHNRSDG